MAELRRLYAKSAEFQLIEALKSNRRQRQRQHRFFVEGVRAITQAVEHAWPVDAILFRRGRMLSQWAHGILERADARTHIEAPPGLLDELSDKEAPSELLAVVSMPPDDPDRIAPRPGLLVVVFDRPSSPGNLGSLIRSCDALGAHGVFVTGHAADVYDPVAIRASMGSLFAVPVVRLPGPDEVAAWLPEGAHVVGTSSGAGRALHEVDLTGPTVLVLGNEAHGMSDRLEAMCTVQARIPMSGAADSLNVAAAGSIALYEAARQRARANGG